MLLTESCPFLAGCKKTGCPQRAMPCRAAGPWSRPGPGHAVPRCLRDRARHRYQTAAARSLHGGCVLPSTRWRHDGRRQGKKTTTGAHLAAQQLSPHFFPPFLFLQVDFRVPTPCRPTVAPHSCRAITTITPFPAEDDVSLNRQVSLSMTRQTRPQTAADRCSRAPCRPAHPLPQPSRRQKCLQSFPSPILHAT